VLLLLLQTINKTEAASDDSREAERRLKDLVAGRRPSLANGGARTAGPGGGAGVAAARGNRSPLNWPFTAKVCARPAVSSASQAS
jgi:hypothetical protein